MTRSNLRHILDATTNRKQHNAIEGAMVVGDAGDVIFHIVKAKTVIIPLVDINIPEKTPHTKAVKQRNDITDDRIEALLWSASDFKDRTFCSRSRVIESLSGGLGQQALTHLFAVGGSRALEVCQGLGFPILEGTPNEKCRNIIIGIAKPIGFNLIPLFKQGEERGAGTLKEGWMIYPACISMCEVTSEG